MSAWCRKKQHHDWEAEEQRLAVVCPQCNLPGPSSLILGAASAHLLFGLPHVVLGPLLSQVPTSIKQK